MFLGSSGLGGTDFWSLQGWILKLGKYSTRLRTSVETFVDCLSNGSLLWTSYCAFMFGLLIAIDKQPGVLPVGVGEIWWYLFANIFLRSRDQKQTWRFRMDICVLDSRRELTARSTGFKIYWMKNRLRRNMFFFSKTQRTRSMRLIKSEWSGLSDTYGRPELVFSSTDIFTGCW